MSAQPVTLLPGGKVLQSGKQLYFGIQKMDFGNPYSRFQSYIQRFVIMVISRW